MHRSGLVEIRVHPCPRTPSSADNSSGSWRLQQQPANAPRSDLLDLPRGPVPAPIYLVRRQADQTAAGRHRPTSAVETLGNRDRVRRVRPTAAANSVAIVGEADDRRRLHRRRCSTTGQGIVRGADSGAKAGEIASPMSWP